jgi:hypothetical protein
MSPLGRKLGRNNPQACSRCSRCASSTSLLRPGTARDSRASETITSRPRPSRISYAGIQCTPVDSIATVLIPNDTIQVRHALEIGRKGLQGLHRFVAQIGRHRHDVEP